MADRQREMIKIKRRPIANTNIEREANQQIGQRKPINIYILVFIKK